MLIALPAIPVKVMIEMVACSSISIFARRLVRRLHLQLPLLRAAISSMRCDRTTRMRSNTDNRMTTPLMT